MDVLEKVAELQEMLTEVAVRNIRKRAVIPVNTTGRCLTCDEPVEDGRRWCDALCRDASEL